MINDKCYITIQGWMVSRLKLTGISLLIYAIIYGFSQDGESTFHGSRQFLADWCGCSISGIKKCLKQLQEAKLIEQVYHSKSNREVYYRAVFGTWSQSDLVLGHKVTEAGTQSDLVLGHKVTEAGTQSDLAIIDNIEDKKEHKQVDIVVCDTKHTRFVPPTLEEVKEYSERNGSAVEDPVRFFDYYTAIGWKVGKNPMKDWKAAFRTWERKTMKEPASSGSSVPYMQNEYTKEHLDQKEKDDLDSLLAELDE